MKKEKYCIENSKKFVPEHILTFYDNTVYFIYENSISGHTVYYIYIRDYVHQMSLPFYAGNNNVNVHLTFYLFFYKMKYIITKIKQISQIMLSFIK